MIDLNHTRIPQELKDLPQWVLWQLEERGGTKTKVPYQPQKPKLRASTTDPATWGTFDQAMGLARGHGFSGIGFVFSADDPYCGIDLDKCRDPQTGEVESWALDIICTFNSYTEVSPSGRGVHIIIKGKLPKQGRRKGKIEMYDQSRFFTITGVDLTEGAI